MSETKDETIARLTRERDPERERLDAQEDEVLRELEKAEKRAEAIEARVKELETIAAKLTAGQKETGGAMGLFGVNDDDRAFAEGHSRERMEEDAKEIARLTRERDAAEAQLAALREAAEALLNPETGFWSRSRATDFDAKVTRGAALRTALSTALSNTQPTAEAYTRRVQAKALRRVAELVPMLVRCELCGVVVDHAANHDVYGHASRDASARDVEEWLDAEAKRIEKGGG